MKVSEIARITVPKEVKAVGTSKAVQAIEYVLDNPGVSMQTVAKEVGLATTAGAHRPITAALKSGKIKRVKDSKTKIWLYYPRNSVVPMENKPRVLTALEQRPELVRSIAKPVEPETPKPNSELVKRLAKDYLWQFPADYDMVRVSENLRAFVEWVERNDL